MTALAVGPITGDYTLSWNNFVLDVSGTAKITSDGTAYTNVTINCADGTNLTIVNVNINNGSISVPCINVTGTASLTLEGTNTLTGMTGTAFAPGQPGIKVANSTNLTIMESSSTPGTDSLTVKGGTGCTGIGGGNGGSGGSITIQSGSVTSTGGMLAAAIGGGNLSPGGTVTINGGTINAKGAWSGPGIGGGQKGSAGTITINGGTVEAYGGSNAAGIGSGDDGTVASGGDITIKGGLVYAAAGAIGANDIGVGKNGVDGDLEFSGTAKVFLKCNLVSPTSGIFTHLNLDVAKADWASSEFYFAVPGTWDFTGEWLNLNSLEYDANSADSGSVPATKIKQPGETFVVAANIDLVRDGYILDGWNTKSDGTGVDYSAGDTFDPGITNPAVSTLYAKWVPEATPTPTSTTTPIPTSTRHLQRLWLEP